MTYLPTKARTIRFGVVRVLQYMGGNRWEILDNKDQRRIMHSSMLTFLK